MPQHQLTTRDLAVAVSVYKYRYLTTSQVQQLHFPSSQIARRRLRALQQFGLISSFTIPNIPEQIFHLTSSGATAVASELGVQTSDLMWSKNTHAPKDYYFMRHFLETGNFRIALSTACSVSDVELLGFIPEYYGSKTSSGHPRKYIRDFVFDVNTPLEKITHTPDAVFALQKEGKPALFFLEIDRGTEVLSNPSKGVYKMIRYYLAYAETERFRGYSEDFNCSEFDSFRVLIVTTSETRRDNMRGAMDSVPHGQRGYLKFFWASTGEQIFNKTPLDEVWLSLDPDDKSTRGIG